MTLKIYNTLTRKKEEFQPLHPGMVGMYVCGPTVYDHPHLGHAKSYVSFDVVVRYLRYREYKVRYVQNITDVGHLTDNADAGEDKIELRARLERLEPMELVEKYMRSYFEDMDALNVLRADVSPRATGHIPEQIGLVEKLREKGQAYEAGGSVYFDVRRFEGYGKLSGRRLEELQSSVRIEPNPEKRYPLDFALWKKALPGHILRWRSPWGEGFPGWHLECSAMSMRYLGETFDIHGGGLENVFPHHECEIAQSEAANERPFVRYWMHNNMVTVGGQKMGKSLGNFVTLKQAFERHLPMVVRFFILNSHYRSPLDYTEEALEAAANGLEHLLIAVRTVKERLRYSKELAPEKAILDQIETHKRLFLGAMDDDFNTAEALAALFQFSREANLILGSGQEISHQALLEMDNFYRTLGGDILGIITEAPQSVAAGFSLRRDEKEEALIQLLIETRNRLRQAKQWQLADELRGQLDKLGILLEDKPEGTQWRRKL
ncbi:MAG TPA: cysteine--tRNA ligase [Candidatus Brocadiales bacterium]|nr:cysteine--tRNA ligase [Candidatus Brocadiales bacterium]